jgi:hypothetical protein
MVWFLKFRFKVKGLGLNTWFVFAENVRVINQVLRLGLRLGTMD